MTDTPDPAAALARELEREFGTLVADYADAKWWHRLARHVLQSELRREWLAESPSAMARIVELERALDAALAERRKLLADLDAVRAQRAETDRVARDLHDERDELRRRIAVLLDAEGVVEPLADGERCPRCGFKQRSGRCQCDVAVHERRLELVRDTHPDHVEADATLRAYLRSQGREVPDEPTDARTGARLYCSVCARAVSESGLCPDAGRHQHDAAQPRTLEHCYLRLQAESERVDRQIKRLDMIEHTAKAQHGTIGGLLKRILALEHATQGGLGGHGNLILALQSKSGELTDLIVELSKDVQALAGKMEGGE